MAKKNYLFFSIPTLSSSKNCPHLVLVLPGVLGKSVPSSVKVCLQYICTIRFWSKDTKVVGGHTSTAINRKTIKKPWLLKMKSIGFLFLRLEDQINVKSILTKLDDDDGAAKQNWKNIECENEKKKIRGHLVWKIQP